MDRVVDAAMRAGIHSVVLNVGGDIVVRGAVSEPIDIADREMTRRMGADVTDRRARCAVATSGDYRRGVDIAGVHYSHIVDPRSGRPARDVISSTVVATNPADAGALATAFSILTPAESQELAAAMPGVEYLLVDKDGQRLASSGWNRLEVTARPERSAAVRAAVTARPVQTPASARGASAQWDPTMELAINFEIPRSADARCVHSSPCGSKISTSSQCGRSRCVPRGPVSPGGQGLVPRRPVAQHVGEHVDRPLHRCRHAPRQMQLKWDGKDQAGNFVKPGKYRVHRVVARTRHACPDRSPGEMTFNGTPQTLEFKPGTELGVVSFECHKIVK